MKRYMLIVVSDTGYNMVTFHDKYTSASIAIDSFFKDSATDVQVYELIGKSKYDSHYGLLFSMHNWKN